MTQSKNDLLRELDGLINGKTSGYELEARFGSYSNERFNSSVNSRDFYRILDHFLTHISDIYTYIAQDVSTKTEQVIPGLTFPHYPDVVTENVYEINRTNVRESFIDIAGVKTPKFYSTKQRVGAVDFENYFTRFSLSKEDNLTYNPVPAHFRPQAVRVKRRWSFIVTDAINHPLSQYRVDLTYVKGWFIDFKGVKRDSNTYEIELEVLDPAAVTNSATDLWPGVRFMLELLQDTPYPVTQSTIDNVKETYNYLFPTEDGQTYKMRNIANKPVNFKLYMLNQSQTLAVTDKADGERKLLYIREDGGYLLFPPISIMKYLLLDDDGGKYTITSEHASALTDTIIDGELVLLDDGTREYLAFDLIMYKGEDCRDFSFNYRLDKLKNLLKEYPIQIRLKEYKLPVDGNFYQLTNEVLDSIDSKPYGNDGLIFNDVNDNYYGKVYKWKMAEKMTIDFKVKAVSPNTFELFVGHDTTKDLVSFSNTRYMKNLPTEIQISDSQVVEMIWDTEKNDFKPYRIRHDRFFPNKLSIALSIWEDIKNPVSEKTIRGHDIRAMRLYHNVVKKEMIDQYTDNNSTLVDIGGGRGGDISKWRTHDLKVLVVEPSIEHLTVLHNRLISTGYTKHADNTYTLNNSFIYPINHYGQDTSKIVMEYVQMFKQDTTRAIEMFNVLTFFFESEEILDSLINTIDILLGDDGYFFGLVMDGGATKKLLGKKDRVEEYGWSIEKLYSDKSDSTYGSKIRINLGSDTIVSEQLEYLVDFDALCKKLKAVDIKLVATDFLVNTNLSPSQATLSGLYRKFVFKRSPPTPQVKAVEATTSTGDFNFVMMDNPLRNKKSVVVNDRTFIKLDNDVEDCGLISALLQSHDLAYNTYNKADKEKMAKKLFSNFVLKFFKSAYFNGELAYARQYYSNWNDLKNVLKSCNNWKYLDVWNAIANVMKINIVVVIADSPFVMETVYRTNTKYKYTAFLYNYENNYHALTTTN